MSAFENEKLIYWIWLSLATENAPSTANTLLKYFGSAQGVYDADSDALEQVPGLSGSRIKLLSDKSTERAERILEYCRKNGVGTVTLDDFFYPERLKCLPNRPVLLYYLGNFIDFDDCPCVAVVGCRKPSDYGVHCAKRISLDLAKAGVVTVSGLAAGIDSCAHKASLYNQSFTVGVLGCGIDVVYPPQNRELYKEVAQNGLIITEYAPSTPPAGRNFPMRNRLICGLSCMTAVIEGSHGSGALITAEYTLRQNRPLFSVPGSIFYQGCGGSNALLALGAKPLLNAGSILEKLYEQFPDKISFKPGIAPKKPKKGKKLFSANNKIPSSSADIPARFEDQEKTKKKSKKEKPQPEALHPSISLLNESELKIYTRLTDEPVLPDALVDESTTVSKVLRTLTSLEIKGFIKKHPGGKFSAGNED